MYSIKRELASSGFCTVEHFNIYRGKKRLLGFWSKEQAHKAIKELKRVDAQCELINYSKIMKRKDGNKFNGKD